MRKKPLLQKEKEKKSCPRRTAAASETDSVVCTPPEKTVCVDRVAAAGAFPSACAAVLSGSGRRPRTSAFPAIGMCRMSMELPRPLRIHNHRQKRRHIVPAGTEPALIQPLDEKKPSDSQKHNALRGRPARTPTASTHTHSLF